MTGHDPTSAIERDPERDDLDEPREQAPLRVAMVSMNTHPFTGRPATGANRQQHEYVARLAVSIARGGHPVTVHTVADGGCTTRYDEAAGVDALAVDEVDGGADPDASCVELLELAKQHSERLLEAWSARPPDVVYAHTWRSGVASQIAARDLGVPVVQTFYGLAAAARGLADADPSSDLRTRLRVAAALARSSASVIALSTADIEALVRLGVNRSRTRLIPAGIDPDLVPTAVAAPEPEEGALRVLALLSGEDPTGLGALQWVEQRLTGLDLTVGWVDPVAGREPADAGGSSRLVPTSAEGLDRMFDAADVVVALSGRDDLVQPVLKAMAVGRPVVGPDEGAVSDAVVDGVTGLLVRPNDGPGLLRALRRLSVDRCELEAMGQAANDRVATRYPWQRIAGESLAVLAAAAR